MREIVETYVIETLIYGGKHYIDDIPSTKSIATLAPDDSLVKPIYNANDNIWIEGATTEEIEENNAVKTPKTISRMKFIIQVYLTTGIKYEDIVLFITNLNFDESQKYVILTRLRSATHFDRYSSDLLTISAMMGITSEQLDEIFINGNLLD